MKIKEEVYLTIEYSRVKKCLLERYSRNEEVPKDSWPPVGSDTFIDLALIKDENITTEFDYSVKGDMDDILKGKERHDYKKLFSTFLEEALILVEGRPGSGKTTLTHKMSRDWAVGPDILEGAKLVFLIPLRMLKYSRKNATLSDILQIFYNKDDAEEVAELLEGNYGEEACFIIDGLDEYNDSNSVITQLVTKKYLRKAMVIVVSRPIGTVELRYSRKVKKRIEVLGFSRSQISEYIGKYKFKHVNGAAELESYLSSHLNILHLCYLPVHVAMICYIYNQMKEIPSTETKIYELFTLLTINRMLKRDSIRHLKVPNSLNDLKGETEESFFYVCKLAFDMTVMSQQTVHQSDTTISLSDGSGYDAYSLGLVTLDATAKIFDFETVYSFLHLTFQEFLAAHFISQLHYEEQLYIISTNKDRKQMLMVWKFYCRIMKFDDLNLEQVQLIMRSDSLSNIQRIQCAFESQQPCVCACVLEDSQVNVLKFQNLAFSPTDFHAIGYVTSTVLCPQELVLEHCRLDHSGISKIDGLDSIVSIKYRTNEGKAQLNILNKLLQKVRRLESFDLQDQELGKEDIETLTSNVTLPNLSTLKFRLPFRDSSPDQEYPHLLKLLSFNSTSLNQIHYYDNSHEPKLKKSFLKHLCNSFKCEIIPLCNNFSGDILSNLDVDFFKVTRFLCLSSLILVNCNINDFQVNFLVKACSMLHILRLDVNAITDIGIACLSEYLRNQFELQNLSISCNRIGNKGAKAIAGALVDKLKLMELDLQCNEIEDEGAIAISQVAADLSDELRLHLWNYRITSEGAKEVTNFKPDKEVVFEEASHRAWDIVSVEDSVAVTQAFKCFRCMHTLDLSGRNLFEFERLSLLGSGLSDCSELKALILNRNHITDGGMKALASGLFHCNLEFLGLHDNRIGKHGAAIIGKWLLCDSAVLSKEILDSLLSNTKQFILDEDLQNHSSTSCKWSISNLRTLDLGKNRIGAEGAAILAFGLRFCNKLQSLNLVSNSICDDGAQALAIGLKNCVTLQTLELDNNLVSVLPKGCIKLETLSLSQNNISHFTKSMFHDLKVCSNLHLLNISDNDLHTQYASEALGEGLKFWKFLRELNIGNNYIGWYVEGLVEGLQYCAELQILSIQNNGMCDKEALMLFEGLQNCKKLRVIEVDNNVLGDSATSALVCLVHHCNSIKKISLRNAKIDDHCASRLIDGLRTCTTLQTLNISKNPIRNKTCLQKLPHCTIITDKGWIMPIKMADEL